MNLKKEDIIKHIKKIRKEIGHEDSEIKIQKLIFNEKNKELWIITPDRPEKSAIIGKGGWVVGRLREETKLNKIHVESNSDFLLKEYRMKLSLEKINSIIAENSLNSQINSPRKNTTKNTKNNTTNNPVQKPLFIKPLKNLKFLLEEKINDIYHFDLENYLFDSVDDVNKDNYSNYTDNRAIVALSGGVDSSFSLILAKKLGFDPLAITIDPGTIVLPKQFKDNIEKLCKNLNVNHEYISVDYDEIIKDSLNGRFHPCGRCSAIIESTIFEYASNNNINLIIFGDMLSTGSQCITKHMIATKNNVENGYNMENENNNEIPKEIYRLNLPATLSIGKEEIKSTLAKYNLEKIKGFGCPLLYETHKKYPHLKKFSIQRILRETRAGALEPGEALDLIWSFYRLE